MQGWLKGINGVGGNDIYGDGSGSNKTTKDVFGYLLHYYGARDYKSISGRDGFYFPAPDVAGGFKPLFNGNIAATAQYSRSFGNSLLFTYKYDVLNRLKAMSTYDSLKRDPFTGISWLPRTLPDFAEAISYDANGNILSYKRRGNQTFAGKPLGMDSLLYSYKPGTNKLDYVSDRPEYAANYDADIDGQSPGNYEYDAIGNLIKDDSAHISNISWTVYGKISSITKTDGTVIRYTYDATGNRISKDVNGVQTWYVRDGSGNLLSLYEKGNASVNNGALTQREAYLYGSERLGVSLLDLRVDTTISRQIVSLPGIGSGFNLNFVRGKKLFELTNHLGNVMATVSDKRLPDYSSGVQNTFYVADVVSEQQYYPFGMMMPGRSKNVEGYRYGFNGQEKSSEGRR